MNSAAAISQMQESMARAFAIMNSESGQFSAEQRRRCEQLLQAMNTINAHAEGAIAALGLHSPAGAVAQPPEARTSSTGASGAVASSAPAPTIDAAEIFRRRREQAQAAGHNNSAPAGVNRVASSSTAGVAPVAGSLPDPSAIFERRRQQAEAMRAPPTPEEAA